MDIICTYGSCRSREEVLTGHIIVNVVVDYSEDTIDDDARGMEPPCSLQGPLWIRASVKLGKQARANERNTNENLDVVGRVILDEVLLLKQEHDGVIGEALQVVRVVLVDADGSDGLLVDVALDFLCLINF